MANRDVFDYWQTYKSPFFADHATEGTCWFKHCLWVHALVSFDPGKAFEQIVGKACRARPEVWADKLNDCDYIYYFHDDKRDRKTTVQKICRTMAKIQNAQRKRVQITRKERLHSKL